MHKFTKALAAIGLAAVMSQSAMAENLKLGFLVKQPEEPWFQTEWKFADKAGKDLGFDVIKIAVPDGEKTLNAIDSLAASGAKGFVICTPDPKLGSAIVAKARGYDMKVITVDDQFVNAKGKPMESVPLVMMAASEIGARQGQELYKEMQKRGWDVKDTAVMAITADELDGHCAGEPPGAAFSRYCRAGQSAPGGRGGCGLAGGLRHRRQNQITQSLADRASPGRDSVCKI